MERPKEVMNAALQAKQVETQRAEPTAQEVRSDRRHVWIVRLMEQEGPGILRLLHRLLSVEADVLDVFQECFCRLAAMGERPDVASARAYAYRTATNLAIELIRARSRHAAHHPRIAREKPAGSTDAGNTAEFARDPKIDLRDALARLPSHLRNVIVLRDLSSMSYADVGRMLNIDPATARVYRRHAVVKLAEWMGGSQS